MYKIDLYTPPYNYKQMLDKNFQMPIEVMEHKHHIHMAFSHNNQLQSNNFISASTNLSSYFDNSVVNLEHFDTKVPFHSYNHLLLYMYSVFDSDYQQTERHNP